LTDSKNFPVWESRKVFANTRIYYIDVRTIYRNTVYDKIERLNNDAQYIYMCVCVCRRPYIERIFEIIVPLSVFSIFIFHNKYVYRILLTWFASAYRRAGRSNTHRRQTSFAHPSSDARQQCTAAIQYIKYVYLVADKLIDCTRSKRFSVKNTRPDITTKDNMFVRIYLYTHGVSGADKPYAYVLYKTCVSARETLPTAIATESKTIVV